MGSHKSALLTGIVHGHIQSLIIAPVLALFFLGIIVRNASSAVDHRVEEQKVTEQLQQRLSEVHKTHYPSLLGQPQEVPGPELVATLPGVSDASPAVTTLALPVESPIQDLNEILITHHPSPLGQPEEVAGPELVATLPGVSDASPAVTAPVPPV